MAGHSKWSNIQHRKKTQDAKRSRLATDLIRKIMVAARENSNPDNNRELYLAIDRAKKENITKEKIENAIKKATEPNSVPKDMIRYEGYGPEGVAILVDVLTDNRNRSASEVRYILSRHEGNLGTTGSVAWSFEKKGLIYLAESIISEHDLMELALEVGAEDIIWSNQNAFNTKLITDLEVTTLVAEALEKHPITIEEASAVWLPKVRTLIENPTLLEKIKNLIDALEALPDVYAVYTSCSWQLD
jgi:YebC/PmpR family DNA-binding regulatory protein